MKYQKIAVVIGLMWALSVHGFTLHDTTARPSPDWFRQGVMYQIQPRAFTSEGTLTAAAEKLPELAQLGVSIVYLCPIFVADDDMNREMWSPRQIKSDMENPRNPYRIKDFFHVDPEYGTDEDLREFVRTAHRCGLKVLLDLVYLHCGPTAKPVIEHPEYFSYDREGKIVVAGWRYPKFDFENTAVREYFKSNMTYYLADFDVDGFRCDVADGIPLDFWEDARVACERIKPDIVILAEGCKHANTRRAFDANYNWPVCLSWLRPILKGDTKEGYNQQWAAGGADVSAFCGVRKLRAAAEQYAALCPKGTLSMNFSENHDTVNDDYEHRMERVRGWDNQSLGLAFCFALRGIPLIYNGQEVADSHRHSIFGHKPDCTVDWTNAATEDGTRRLALTRRLIELRQSNAALTVGSETWLDNDCEEFVLSLVRSAEGARDVVFVGNFDGRSRTVSVVDVDVSKMDVVLSNGARISGSSFELQPWGFAYLVGEVK